MRYTVLASIAMVALIAGCSDETTKEMKPCPPKGIGVEAADGTACTTATINQTDPKYKAAYDDCVNQVTKYEEYSCIDPEICVDMGVYIAQGVEVGPMTAPFPVNFVLTNCTTSNKKLNITKVVVMGDKRCSFSEPNLETKEIAPGKSVLLQATYKPLAPGVDYATIQVTSDAQNFKPLKLASCGRAMARFKPGLDSGPTGAGADAATNKPLRCDDVSSQGVTATCHKE